MDLAWHAYMLAIVAGVVAGVANTLAGSGSLVTLPLLVFLGLPADVANGTNRIGVIAQAVVGILSFRRAGLRASPDLAWLLWPSLAGALAGAWLATRLDAAATRQAIGVVMVVMLFVVVLNPKQWLREESEPNKGRPGTGTLAIFFAIGLYGGFIQAGVGVLMLAALVLGDGYNMNQANLVKLLIVLLTTLASFPIFVLEQKVHWGLGCLVAAGQCLGAWAGARFATRVPNSNLWIRRLLITIIVVAIFEFFGGVDLTTRLIFR